jgi:alpha-1,2-mannosyltransferase
MDGIGAEAPSPSLSSGVVRDEAGLLISWFKRVLVPIVVIACLLGYAVQAAGPWADEVWEARHARDFASYYYAVQVSAEGGDPYDTALLEGKARAERTRKQVHPYFYPPPFLLLFLWVLPLSLQEAYRTWFLVDHGLLLAVLLALWRWLPGRATILVLALMAVSYSPIPDNAWMGQVNLLVMAFALWGLLLAERGSDRAGGLLLGTACMLKMSPALLVGWWLLRGRWRPAVWACLAAFLWTLVSLPLLGAELQWRFYTEVLPGFGNGDYHGLSVPILLPSNHSIPSILAEILPGGRTRLSPAATWLSRGIAALLLGLLAWRVRRHPARDPLGGLAELGAILVLMLLLPLYTYEHHMVWMIVPYAACFLGLLQRRLGLAWIAPLVIAYAAQATPLAWIPAMDPGTEGGLLAAGVHLLLREAKFLAALLVGVACVVLAGHRVPEPGDAIG